MLPIPPIATTVTTATGAVAGLIAEAMADWLLALRDRPRRRRAARYVTSALVTAVGFGAAAVAFAPWGWAMPVAAMVVIWATVVIASADWTDRIIPTEPVYMAYMIFVGLGVLTAATGMASWRRVGLSVLISAVVWVLSMAANRIAAGRSYGRGDVRIGAVAALAAGWFGLPYMAVGYTVAFLTATLAGIIVRVTTGKRYADIRIPMGPYFAIAVQAAAVTYAVVR